MVNSMVFIAWSVQRNEAWNQYLQMEGERGLTVIEAPDVSKAKAEAGELTRIISGKKGSN